MNLAKRLDRGSDDLYDVIKNAEDGKNMDRKRAQIKGLTKNE